MTLVLLGQVLELRARSRTSSAVRELLALSPTTAHRLSGDGEEDIPWTKFASATGSAFVPAKRFPSMGA